VHTVDDAFNFSRLCNEGVLAGPDTPFVLLLNNDVEIRHRRWLLQLSGWLRDPAVVAAGPKLLFPDGTIQHGGVVLGMGGIAGHYAGGESNQPRLGNLHDQAREVGCLTAACLLMRSADYHRVGGMNEDLPTDFQDVDFCLRLRRDLGKSLVYDPTYPLKHLQSATRGSEGSSGYTLARMHFLWDEELMSPDPYYSPHLTLDRHDCSLATIPSSVEVRRSRLQARHTPARTR
jgi:GT2 family glycosyltransferase